MPVAIWLRNIGALCENITTLARKAASPKFVLISHHASE
jgi:hypothetical protein